MINPALLNKFIKVSERAAYGASKYIGKNDKISADQAAVDEMRSELNKIEMNGKVVIGEGEMDEAPMLFIGEKIGTGAGDDLEIAVDPLEGTNFVANNLPNSFSMLAVTEKDNLFFAPDTYMEKIAIGANLPQNIVNLDNTSGKGDIIDTASAQIILKNNSKINIFSTYNSAYNESVNLINNIFVNPVFIYPYQLFIFH